MMIRRILLGLIVIVCFGGLAPGVGLEAQSKPKLNIGVTLLPYYSFVANIVGDLAEVSPLIPAEQDPHGYKPMPQDIKRISDFDVLVVNGIGHDEFAFEILKAAQLTGDIPLIFANDGVALIPVSGTGPNDKTVNSHTFVSITTSIQQIQSIARSLAELDPENGMQYKKNARTYSRKLRRLKAQYMQKISDVQISNFRCATIHGAYGYFLHEFGIKISAVIEPRHGVEPSAAQLMSTIDKIKEVDVDVIFSEMKFSNKYVDTIRRETGVSVYSFSHISGGPYEPHSFEREMQKNMEALTQALLEVNERDRASNRSP